MISLLYAETPAASPASAPSPLMSMVPLLVIFVIFYFLMIRPQQKRQKEHQKLLQNLKVGNRVLTSSGFYGVVVAVGENSLDVKLADNVKVKILKSAVSEVLGSGDKPELEAEKKA